MTARIMVVEDQQAMQRNMRLALGMAGYEVVTALDGQEALELLSKEPVDLILADIGMPRMNGYQLYEALRRHPSWALIPFIFVSARAFDSDIRYGKALGADDYLIKPFQLEDLLAVAAGRLRRARELAKAASLRSADTTAACFAQVEGEEMTAGPVRLNRRQHRVWRDEVPVELSPREFTFLEYLVSRPGQAIPLTELCKATHDLECSTAEAGNLLYPLVRSLRRRLGYTAGEMGCIESVRGIGYRLAT